MIHLGKYNVLEILKETSFGLYLVDDSDQEVLLPLKYCPKDWQVGDKMRVFVYRDSKERFIATTLTPKIKLGEFASLTVTDVTPIGTFMDWGLEKELLVPFREQRQEMEVGRNYVVYLDLDTVTDRLYASTRLDKFMNNEDLTVKEGDKVDLLVYSFSDIGFSVICNNKHKGLIYKEEVFKRLHVGNSLTGYVKNIREDKKLDISIQAIGYENFIDPNSESIYKKLVESGGFLPLTDKSSPELIYAEFGISKKIFKKSLGNLYKQRKILIQKTGIKLNS